MRRLRILVLTHEDLIPPEDISGMSERETLDFKTEYDVISALRKLRHDVRPLGLSDELAPLRQEMRDWQPHIAFNLLEEFHAVAAYDQYVVAYLELMKQPYTGCNPAGLLLSRDKVLSKKIMLYHRIPTPRFVVYRIGGRRPSLSKLQFPLIVKSATEDSSLTLSQASVVNDEAKLNERVEFVHEQTGTDVLVEEYIDGRELYVGVLGNQRLQTLPVWEMNFGEMPHDAARMATRKVKWDLNLREKYGIGSGPARQLPPDIEKMVIRRAKRIYRALQLSGYARIDMRLRPDGQLYVLEANANPELSYGDDLADSAKKAGLSYSKLVQKIVTLGLNYKAAWRT